MEWIAVNPSSKLTRADFKDFFRSFRILLFDVREALVQRKVNASQVLAKEINDVKSALRGFCHRPVKKGHPGAFGPIPFSWRTCNFVSPIIPGYV
jgi:hypothetical protein